MSYDLNEFHSKNLQEDTNDNLGYNYLKQEIRKLYGFEIPMLENSVMNSKIAKAYQFLYVKIKELTQINKQMEEQILKNEDNLKEQKKKNDILQNKIEKQKHTYEKDIKDFQKESKRNQLEIIQLSGDIKKWEGKFKKIKGELKTIQDKHLKKQISKKNTFEISKIKTQVSSKYLPKEEFNKQNLFDEQSKVFVSNLMRNFDLIYNCNKTLLQSLQKLCVERKGYLYKKLQDDQITNIEDSDLQDFENLENQVKELRLDEIQQDQLNTILDQQQLFVKFIVKFEKYLNSDFRDYLEQEHNDNQKTSFQPKQLGNNNFKRIKRVNELHTLLESYNDLAEKQRQLNLQQEQALSIKSHQTQNSINQKYNVIENLKKNIENLNLYLNTQKKTFEDQQKQFQKNEKILKEASETLGSALN